MTEIQLHPRFVFERIGDGNAYIVNKILNVGADSSANLHIRNPHVDKKMWVVASVVAATGRQYFYMHDLFDSITDGDSVTIQNALLDSAGGAPDSGPFEAFSASTFSATADSTVPIALTVEGQTSSQTTSLAPIAIEPGRQVVIEADNQKANSEVALISLMLCSSY